MKKLMFALAIASISSATFAQQSNKSQKCYRQRKRRCYGGSGR